MPPEIQRRSTDLSDFWLAALSRWMDDHELETGAISDVEPLSGGTQNTMLRFSRGERSFVLRSGPRHLRPTSNRAIRREITLLKALRRSDVPHARLIADCTDESVLGGALFYLMEPVDGFNPAAELPELHQHGATLRWSMGVAAIDAAACLGRVDHRAIGLAGFGRPRNFLQRQVPRWLGELQSYDDLNGYSGHHLPVKQTAAWLQEHLPSSSVPGLMHGDFHLGNLMFSTTGPEVAAIVDWEMCTIGDPLLDLGLLLATWPEPGSTHDILDTALGRAGGLPGPAELVSRYQDQSDRDLAAIDWYTVLACFKLGILLEGTFARSQSGKAPLDIGVRLRRIAAKLFDRAASTIDQ